MKAYDVRQTHNGRRQVS